MRLAGCMVAAGALYNFGMKIVPGEWQSLVMLTGDFLLAMGLLFGLLFAGFEPSHKGIGGDLGATAAVSVFAVLGLQALLRRLQGGAAP